MRIRLLCVGRPGALLAPAIEEYETRAGRYWNLEQIEVKEERATRGRTPAAVMEAEAERLLERVPDMSGLIALTRTGDAISSDRFARMLQRFAVDARDATFVLGGAFGLADQVLREAAQRMRLSTFTLPHDLARLLLAEQLYRAGTINRGEPYHKAPSRGER